MKLTPKEQEICDKYGKPDKKGYVHCSECPLNLYDGFEYQLECYATIDGRKGRGLKRYDT